MRRVVTEYTRSCGWGIGKDQSFDNVCLARHRSDSRHDYTVLCRQDNIGCQKIGVLAPAAKFSAGGAGNFAEFHERNNDTRALRFRACPHDFDWHTVTIVHVTWHSELASLGIAHARVGLSTHYDAAIGPGDVGARSKRSLVGVAIPLSNR